MTTALGTDAKLAALEARLTDRIDALAARLPGATPTAGCDAPDDDTLGITLNLAGVQHRLKALLEDVEGWVRAGEEYVAAGHAIAGIKSILRDSGEVV